MEEISKLFTGYTLACDAYNQIETYCLCYGTRVLVVGGITALTKAWDKMVINLNNFTIVGKEMIYKECTYKRIDEIVKMYHDLDVEMVFAVGGGKACDSGKTIAEKLSVPVFTFPTIVSNCAAMSAMSVIYHEDGSLDEFFFMKSCVKHCFMDAQILIEAPFPYLKAGMADTLAKYYECHFSSRNDVLDYHSALGKEISNLCRDIVLRYAKDCLQEVQIHNIGKAFQQVVLAVLVNTGLVSHLVEDCYNCALAHSVCYGLDTIKRIQERYLHGELVGYGLLIQCLVDQDEVAYEEVKKCLIELGTPVSLTQMGLKCDRNVLEEMLFVSTHGPDMEHIPYVIDADMVYDAMVKNENRNVYETQCNL